MANIQLVNIVESYGLELDNGDIDDLVLFEAMQRAEVLQSAGGVRALIRALEKRLADVQIDIRKQGAHRGRFTLDDLDVSHGKVTITS